MIMHSTIAACRLVMRLHNYKASGDLYIHTTTMLTGDKHIHYAGGRPSQAVDTRPTPEVHVTTTTITVGDFPAVPQKAKAMRSSSRLSIGLESVLGSEK
ncbi:uncharacterized protein PHACADRAFT_205914 [Phanerochaete carnosa HHB-10118-sp]|uniref:Uncharacterized protein n=1 Tax=Phanerochaete carnosa (strain HHB-10118-sp) TaxID=650164 RepID=K5VA01_PHACS|nr:uncharacterized protein PHACADRAFT_205914 [Phanerochaete carnosa HHB-10118-sp]EKM59691.1 hypothetical protein PHACADRAFT_205914 [Phanerochaete carnosa HHB-10118-sp]